MKPADIPRALRLASHIAGHEETTEREEVLAAALIAVTKDLEVVRGILATSGGAELLAAVGALPAEDAQALAALLALGTRTELLARCQAAKEYQGPRDPRPWSSTPARAWLEGLALQLWNALAGKKS